MTQLESWIDSFVEYVAEFPTAPIFSRWAGIATVGAVLERRVWLNVFGGLVAYPNMYTLLVGPPSAGKGIALGAAKDLLREVPEIHLAPTSVSAASLTDSLHDAKREFIQFAPELINEAYNALTIYAEELGNFMPSYEPTFAMAMINFWDSKQYTERKRTSKLNIKIEKPVLNFLAATTPSFLGKYFADGTWDQGFASRSVLVYSGDRSIQNPFAEARKASETLKTALIEDLKEISKIYGKMTFEADAAAAFWAWIQAGYPPLPTHPKLLYYNGRRETIMLKLCMIITASRGGMVIDLNDYQTALTWLTDAELVMPDIFKHMSISADGEVLDEAFQWLFNEFLKNKQEPVPPPALARFLSKRMPGSYVQKTIELMVQSEMIVLMQNTAGKTGYKPVPKQEHRAHS